jgi:hypothetical protein
MKRLLLCLACLAGASCAVPPPMPPDMPIDRDFTPGKPQPAIARATT